MLLQQEAREVARSGVMETAKATIKATPKIFSFFADQTYANKPKAICRELVANAWDSHVMAGNTDPVEVWLPTLVDPVFKVRDFGLGMSHEFMMNDFMRYTDGSTKDQSNIAIGGFGIGSKSPFAYVDQFTIRSIFDGVKSVYSVFKDEDGIPSIALLNQGSTDDPNGVEVSFPVQPEDFDNFRVAAFEALKYFDPLPTVRNCGQHKFEPPEYVAKGKMWGMRKESGALQVVMGGIMYPVDPNALSHKFNDETARKMLNYGLDIKVPIGSCSVALSREALSYDDRTVEGLTKACLNVVDEVAASFSKMFDQYPSWWDARTALYEEVYPNGQHGYRAAATRGGFLEGKALYHGQQLGLRFDLNLPGGGALWEIDPKHNRRSPNCPNPKWEVFGQYPRTLIPGQYEHVIIDDLERSAKSKPIARIREFVNTLPQDKKILVVRAADDRVKATDILVALSNPSNHTLTSTLPEPARITTASGVVRPKIRMFTYDGSNRPYYSWQSDHHDTLNPGRYGKKGVDEIEYAKQPSSGIAVKMDKWTPTPTLFWKKMELGLIKWDEVYYVNSSDFSKLDATQWKDFNDVFEARLKKALKSNTNVGEMLAVERSFDHDMLRVFKNNPVFAFSTKRQQESPFAKLQEIFRTYVEPITDEYRKYLPFVSSELPKGVDPEKLRLKFKEKHPRAYKLLNLLGPRLDGDDLNFFLDTL